MLVRVRTGSGGDLVKYGNQNRQEISHANHGPGRYRSLYGPDPSAISTFEAMPTWGVGFGRSDGSLAAKHDASRLISFHGILTNYCEEACLLKNYRRQ